MEMRETETPAGKREVWNDGRTVGAKCALKPKQIWEIRFDLNERRRLRDRELLELAIDSKLRGCALIRMKISDIVSGGQIRTRAIVLQQESGQHVQFELLPDARASLLAWFERRGCTMDDYGFPSRVYHNRDLSTRQHARLVDEWVTGNLCAVQILLCHRIIQNTWRYLGIDVQDALALAENSEI